MSIHIAAKAGEIADTVLLPGDPLRARFIAERQFFRRPGHHMDHAFMMWDADAQALVQMVRSR